MSRSQVTSTVGQNTGGAVPPVIAGKNFLINGGMDFFQRTSFSTTTSGYALDRWYANVSSSASATTVTQQTTGAPVGSQYCMRIAMGASSGYGNMYQFMETKNVAALWGKTVTITLKLRRSSNFTRDITVVVQKSATVDAPIGATWSAIATAGVSNANLPTGTTSSDWYTATITVAIPNDGTANSLAVYTSMSNVDTSSYYEMAQAQLEIGSVATPFSRAGGTLSGELQACQRYYYREGGDAPFQGMGQGIATSTTNGNVQITLPVQMRVAPTSIDFSTLGLYNSGSVVTVTGATIDTASKNIVRVNAAVASGLILNSAYQLLANNSTSALIGFSAEL